MGGKRRRGGALTGLLAAFGFLTVFPVPEKVWESAGPPGRSFAWFPLVGGVLGVVTAVAALGLDALLPGPVSAALLVGAGVALTGGLHLDGLIDSCDGLFCAKDPADRLEVMRDSAVGAFGVLGAVCLLLVKYASLSVLFGGEHGLLVAALILSPVLGRWGMVAAAVSFPYGRDGGSLGSAFVRTAGPRQLAAACACGVALTTAIGLWQGLVPAVAALVAGGAAACAFVAVALRRLPGLTGDVYGAVGEIVEAVTLAVFAGWCCA